MEKINLALTVLLSGLIVVFFALIVLTFIIKGYGKVINKILNTSILKAPKKQNEKEEIAEASYKKDDKITNETIAAISAAVYSIYGYSHKIYSVKRIKHYPNRSIWNVAGTFENTRPF